MAKHGTQWAMASKAMLFVTRGYIHPNLTQLYTVYMSNKPSFEKYPVVINYTFTNRSYIYIYITDSQKLDLRIRHTKAQV